MENVKRILQMTSLLFGMVMLFCYIAWHLGYEGFIIVGNIELPYLVHFCLCLFMLLINISLLLIFTLNEYNWGILKYSIPLVISEGIRSVLFPDIIAQVTLGYFPMIASIFIGLYKKKQMFYIDKRYILPIFRGVVPRMLIINSVILSHQFILSRITQTPLNHEISVYALLRFNIDIILMYLLFCSIGGVNNARWEQLVFPRRPRDDKSWNEGRQDSSDDCPVTNFEKWIVRSVIGVTQVLQWSFILWVCSLDNLFLDALVMTTSFICHGMIISKRKHLKPIILCTLAATAMFYFAARFTISFHYSQFFPIVIGLILVYTLYRVSYQFEEAAYEKAQKDLERIEILEKKVSTVWEKFDELSKP